MELTVDGPAFDIKPIDVPGIGSLLSEFSRHEKRGSVIVQSNGPQKRWWANPCAAYQMFDDCRLTCWQPDPGATEVSVTLDLGKPVSFNRALIDCDGPLDGLEIKVKEGENWKSVATFKTPGKQQQLQFDKATAQIVRLSFKTSDPAGCFASGSCSCSPPKRTCSNSVNSTDSIS